MRPASLARAATLAALLVPVAACAQSNGAPPPGNSPNGGGYGGGQGMTFQQFEARRMDRMMALDTDGDGRVSRAEFLAGQKGGQGDPARRFQRLDVNGDGYLDRGEIDAMLRRRFDRMDANHDGVVTPAERAALHGGQAQAPDNG